MNRPRIFGLLRIAVTVLSLSACVLLIALWVRSYTWADTLYVPTSNTQTIALMSGHGGTAVSFAVPTLPGYFAGASKYQSTRINDSPLNIGSEQSSDNFPFAIITQPFLTIYVPYWFLTAFVAALAAIPWLRWRFSVRTLLIATTLIAVVLGLIVLIG